MTNLTVSYVFHWHDAVHLTDHVTVNYKVWVSVIHYCEYVNSNARNVSVTNE